MAGGLASIGLQIGQSGANRWKADEAKRFAQDEMFRRMSFGYKQLDESKKLAPAPITYTTPGAIDEYSKMLGGLSREGLPGERMIAEEMGANVAGAVGEVGRVADTSAGALGAVSGLYNKYMSSVRDLGIQSAQQKAANEREYRLQGANAALTRADYADKAWEYNVNLPYQRALNKSERLEQSGYANIFGASDAATAGAIDYSNSQASQMNQWMQMMPYMNFGTGRPPLATPSPTYGTSNPTAPGVYQGAPQIPIPGAGSNYSGWKIGE